MELISSSGGVRSSYENWSQPRKSTTKVDVDNLSVRIFECDPSEVASEDMDRRRGVHLQIIGYNLMKTIG